MRVLICGGGIVGASIAYFLARRSVASTVIERNGLACAASGKGGGFLAAGWCDGTPVGPLARRSFALHAKLAEEIEGDWGYRRLDTYGGSVGNGRRSRNDGPSLSWLSEDVALNGQLGSINDTAQVHPGQLAAALMQAAKKAAGAELRSGEVTGVLRSGAQGKVTGVKIDGEALEGDAVVIAMGPWSQLARRWLPLPAVYALKGHSLIFDTGRDLPPEALFLEHRDADGVVSSPEIFPRADGTTYIAAINSETPLPVNPADVAPDPGALDRLYAIAAAASPILARSKVLSRQACYRPITRDGLPLIGAVPGLTGAYVATGHSVWGILNAPATGEAMAELILDGRATTVPLAAFDPTRFSA